MKFDCSLPKETQKILEKQYKEYIKTTPMTKKEQRVLREWVKAGHSVYENTCGAWADGQVPIEFLTIYREEEYIRQQTKGMSPEETHKFAMNYYGWDDPSDVTEESYDQDDDKLPFIPMHFSTDEELPFC